MRACAVLLQGIDEEPDIRGPPPPPRPPQIRDGRWLRWAAEKRDCVPWFDSFGREHGYPRHIEDWSRGMVALAVDAKITQQKTGAKS